MTDRLQTLFVAVWRNNRWPVLGRPPILTGFSRKHVRALVTEHIGEYNRRDVRIVRYVPARKEKGR